MTQQTRFSREALAIDAPSAVERITTAVREQVTSRLKRRGAVVAVSGGIDSSVVLALCARALGPGRVLALFLPERDSSPDSERLGRLLASQLGVEGITEDITPALEAVRCYARRDEAVKEVIPEYGPGWRCKIVLPGVTDSDRYRLFSVVARSPDGREVRERLTLGAYLGIVAATNFKQRVRKMLEYHHADRRNFAVAGTPNRLEYDQGFFVKLGDGAADVKPIAHLYKSQVYQVAEALGVPEEIRRRPPTTDTYSLAQSQEEFYFSLPYAEMDLCLYARDHQIAPSEVAEALGRTPIEIERVFRDIDSKRAVARGLLMAPLRVDD